MKKHGKSAFFVLLILSILSLAGCAVQSAQVADVPEPVTPQAAPGAEEPAGTILFKKVDFENLSRALKGHEQSLEGVESLVFFDGKAISGSYKKKIRIWDMETGMLLNTFRAHKGSVELLAVTEGMIVSAGDDRTVKVWDLETGRLLRTLSKFEYPVLSITAVQGKAVTASIGRPVEIWDLKTGELLKSLSGHKNGGAKIATVSDGRVVSSGFDETIKVWDMQTGELLKTMPGHQDVGQESVFLGASNGKIVSVCKGNHIKIWDLYTGDLVKSFILDPGLLYFYQPPMVVSENKIYYGDGEKNIRVLDLNTDRELKSFETDSTVRHIALSGGKILFSQFFDIEIRDVSVALAMEQYAQRVNKKNPFESVQEITQNMTDDYQKSLGSWKVPTDLYEKIPPKVPKPVIPPAPELVKNEFETTKAFQERVKKAAEDREKFIAKLQRDYRDAVEQRNKEIEELKIEVQAEQKKVEGLLAEERKDLPEKVQAFTKQAFFVVMGHPVLTDAKYDPDNQVMYVNFKSSTSDYAKRIQLHVPLSVAKEFKERMGEAEPVGIFKIVDNGILLKSIRVGFEGRDYVAQLTDRDYQPQKVTVALKDKQVNFAVQQEASDLDQQLQNPNLLDTQYRVTPISYQESGAAWGRDYQDDLAPLIQKVEAVPIDPRNWLMIVAVENYDEADRVMFAGNSAKAFKKTAQKVFGVSERKTYALIDRKATSGAVKDKLNYLLQNVKEGDTIYFYYSGHGVPDPHSRNCFILPRDKVVDFISREEAFNLSNIYHHLTESRASRIVAFIDACFSGKTDNRFLFKGVAPGLIRSKEVRFDEEKMVVMTAGKADQFSNSFDEKGHRMFSYYLMKSLLMRDPKDLDTVYKEVSLNVRDRSWNKGDVYLQEPQISGNRMLDLR